MLVHDWPGFHRDDGFRSGWAITQSTVGSFGVVVFPPLFNQDLRFPQAVEDLPVQQFISELAVVAFNEAVLLGLSRRDVVPIDACILNPLEDRHAGELSAVTPSE